MYNFEHHSSQVAAEWGVCVVIADVRHTLKNVCFCTSVQKLLTLLFSPFTQTWLTIWPSKKYTSHTDINLKKIKPLLSTFLAHLLAFSHIYMLDSFMFEMACFWDDFVSVLSSAMSYLLESSWCSVHVQWDGHQMWTAVSQVCNTYMVVVFSESSMKCNQTSKKVSCFNFTQWNHSLTV